MELELAISVILKEKRTNLGLSQEELAHRCDIDRTYISMIERGKRKPTISVLFKICNALQIKPNEFIKEIEEYIHDNKNNDQ